MKTQKIPHVDFAVVGCGVAGLRGAIELSSAGKVLVLAKSSLNDSATEWAQGGIAAALSDEDEVSLHEQDTLLAGDGLCRPEAVKILVEEGPRYIQELIEWGTQFDHAGTKLAFTREAAHSRSRILHAQGDSTGREIGRALLARAQSCAALQILPFAFTTELLMEDQRVKGLRYLNESSGEIEEVHAEAVLLATGGLGQVTAKRQILPLQLETEWLSRTKPARCSRIWSLCNFTPPHWLSRVRRVFSFRKRCAERAAFFATLIWSGS
jgi:L-aspartate oxidase